MSEPWDEVVKVARQREQVWGREEPTCITIGVVLAMSDRIQELEVKNRVLLDQNIELQQVV